MTVLTRVVLRHKLIVVLVWLGVAVAGVLTVGATAAGMTNNAAMPGNAYLVDSQIVRTYGNGGGTAPLVPVVTTPAGTRIGTTAAVQAHRALQAAAAAVPGSRLVDLATTGNRAFVTNDGRTTFGLLYTTPETSFGGPDPSAALAGRWPRACPPDGRPA